MSSENGERSVGGILLAVFFALFMVATVAGFLLRDWRPVVASSHGEMVDELITYLLVTAGVVFVIGHVVLLWFVWRGSIRAGRPASKTARPSRRAEWIWALIPVLVIVGLFEGGVLFLGHPAWQAIHGEVPDDAIELEVVGKQFEWIMRYPGKDGQFGRTDPSKVHETRNPLGLDKKDPNATDDIVFRGQLVLPIDRVAAVRLRSHDVTHCLAVPALRVKQDVVPGFPGRTLFKPTRLSPFMIEPRVSPAQPVHFATRADAQRWLDANSTPGEGSALHVITEGFDLACAELCGVGHYSMRGKVIVKTAAEFDKWLGGQRGWFEPGAE